MKKILPVVLASACVAMATPTFASRTFASGSQWTALVAYDDGGLAPQMLPIAADSEEACLAAVSSYRGAEVIEPCQPTASAITDPNDKNRTRPRRKQPSTPDPQPSGNGSSGGGHGGGGGGGW